MALNAKTLTALRMQITNTSANPADLGAANVTAGSGYSLPAGATISVQLNAGDQLWGVRSDAVLSVLIS